MQGDMFWSNLLQRYRLWDSKLSFSQVLWCYNGYQLPQYGNRATMPTWWPDELMPWVSLKNLRHKVSFIKCHCIVEVLLK